MRAEDVREKLRHFLLKTKAEQTAILFSYYLLVYLIFFGAERLFLANIALLLVFLAVVLVFRSSLFTAWFWVAAAILMAMKTASGWNVVANHCYLIAYMCLMMMLAYLQPADVRDDFIVRQSRYVFALVMLMAGFQKLITPQYTDGSQLEFMFLTGDFAGVIFNRDIFFAKEIAANNDIFFKFGRAFVADPKASFEWYSPFFHSIARPLAWVIISAEFALGALALFFFNRTAFQAGFLLFIAGLFVITPEGGFVSLLIILGWSQLPAKPVHMHYVFVSCLILILALLVTRNSFG